MKRLSLVALLMALMASSEIALAQEKDDEQKPVITKTIVIGSDPNMSTEDMSKLIQAQTGIAIKMQNSGDRMTLKVEADCDSTNGKPEGQMKPLKIDIEKMLKMHGGGAFIIGPDGKPKPMESVPEDIKNIMKMQTAQGGPGFHGTITVIGPDGKKQTKPLAGDIDGKSITAAIKQAIEGSGEEMPKDLQKTLDQVLKGLSAEMITVPVAPATTKEDDSIASKLDEIIKRLDTLEKEVQALKASK